MKTVNLYKDGACSGNPGNGGYGAVLEFMGTKKELSGGYKNTTNNRMELMAVIKGLEALKEECIVTVTSDSKYVVDAFNKGWLDNWIKKNWVKSDRKPVLNVDLWKKLCELTNKHRVTFNWIEGHNGHPENERCDALAVAASISQNLSDDNY